MCDKAGAFGSLSISKDRKGLMIAELQTIRMTENSDVVWLKDCVDATAMPVMKTEQTVARGKLRRSESCPKQPRCWKTKVDGTSNSVMI